MAKTLDEYAAGEARRGRSVIDRLPQSVQDELLGSRAGHAAAARWLKKEHNVEHVTDKIVRDWRTKKGYGTHDDVS